MDKYYGWGLPIDISTYGAEVDRLINIMHVIMVALFIGWGIFLLLVLFKFRARPGHKAVHHTKHFKAPTYIEILVAATEILLLAAFSTPLWQQYKRGFPDPAKSLEVHVIAQQFAWNIHYPGADRQFGKRDVKLINASNPIGLDSADPAAADDVVTINQLNIPVNTPVIARLSSKDVIHSFSLQVMRVKQDVVPGQVIPIWFEATKTGDFEIACAQLCGLGHYRMKGFFNVQTKEQFDTWFASQLQEKVKV